jgi:hypothetical protein
MSSSCRHPDFEKIHSAFLSHYSKDPKLGESRYANWVKFSDLDETQSYYLQGAARAGTKQSFEWANFLLQFVKEDKEAFYYKVEALFPVESMNDGPPFTRDEVLQSARTLTGKPSNLNHTSQDLKGVEVVAAQFEDDCVECLVRVLKSSPLIGMIDRKEIVNVSIEGEWSHGVPGQGLVLTGLGWLTKSSTLPGIPLTRIMPVERIVESFFVPIPAVEAVEERTITKIGSCVGCGGKADYLVSACKACFGKFSAGGSMQEPSGDHVASGLLASLARLPLGEAEAYLPVSPDYSTFKVRFQALGPNPCARCQALDGKTFVYGSQPELPIHEHCNCGYDVVERLHVRSGNLNGVEKLEEKEMDKIAEKVALKVGEKSILEFEKLKIELAESQKKVVEAEGKLKIAEDACVEANGKLSPVTEKLAVAEKTLSERNAVLEKFKKCMPGLELLADPPVLMSVSEHLVVLEGLAPSVMVERSSQGMQVQGQKVRAAILQAQKRLRAK